MVSLPARQSRATGWQVEAPRLSLAWVLREVVSAGIAVLLLLGLPVASLASTMTGMVMGIADGDTLPLLDADHVQHKIRLAGIDAPEKRQAFGDRSKQNLAALVARRQVAVEWNKLDRYGRVIGKVLIGSEDVCLAQVRAGLAWHYKAYEREQTPVDRQRYGRAELEARANKRGIWRDLAPTPPWDFRQLRRRGY
jgi:endonuclease YncB( thermonuclease family)